MSKPDEPSRPRRERPSTRPGEPPPATPGSGGTVRPGGTAREDAAHTPRGDGGLGDIRADTAGDIADAVARARETTGGRLEIAGYEILEELGRGGMGVVYKAREEKLKRIVALKMIRGGTDRRLLIRFLAEAEAVASIRHAHVVQVYRYGESGGAPYMALEYCAGGNLADRLKAIDPAKRPSPHAMAKLVYKLACGIAAAHAQGIIHRDLKPANVLFDETGQPKVTDFGLARRGLGDALTRTGMIIGTPAYMAPEQASGGGKYVGPPADVWALGVILYECLSGARPFDAGSTEELLARIVTTNPKPLSKVASGVPRDLDAICTKCLSKDPVLRYPSAQELADDLARFIGGESLAGRTVTSERSPAHNANQPRRGRAGLLKMGFTFLLAGAAAALGYLWYQASQERDTARQQRATAETERDRATTDRDYAHRERDDAIRLKGEAEKLHADDQRANAPRLLQYAFNTLHVGNLREAKRAFAAASAEPGWERDFVGRRVNCEVTLGDMADQPPATTAISAFHHTPDGRYLSAIYSPEPGSQAGHIRVWDAATGKVVRTFPPPGAIADDAAISHDGAFALVRYWLPSKANETIERPVKVYEIASGREVGEFRTNRVLQAADATHGSGRLLVLLGKPGQYGVWGNERFMSAPAMAPPVEVMPKPIEKSPEVPSKSGISSRLPAESAISPEFVAAQPPKPAPVANGRAAPPQTQPNNGNNPPGMALPNANEMFVFDTNTGRRTTEFELDSAPVIRCGLILNGQRVWAVELGAKETRIREWDTATGKRRALDLPVVRTWGETTYILSDDTEMAAIACDDGSVAQVNLSTGKVTHTYTPAKPKLAPPTTMPGTVVPGGATWNGVEPNTDLALVHFQAKRPADPPDPPPSKDPGGEKPPPASQAQPLPEPASAGAPFTLGTFNSDGTRLTLYMDYGTTVRTHDTRTGNLIAVTQLPQTPQADQQPINGPDARWIALPGFWGELRLIDLNTGRRRGILVGRGMVLWAAFSHDGRRIAVAGNSGLVGVWEVDRPDYVEIPINTTGTRALGYTPDGSAFVVQSWPTTVWDPEAKAPRTQGGGLFTHDSRTGVRTTTRQPPEGFEYAFLRDGRVYLYKIESGNLMVGPDGPGPEARTYTLPAGWTERSVIWHPNGRKFLAFRNGLSQWDAATGKEDWRTDIARVEMAKTVTEYVPVQMERTGIRQTPDGPVPFKYVVTEYKAVMKMMKVMGPMVEVSPDGSLIALISPDTGSVRILDASTGKELYPISGTSSTGAVSFSPDGKRVAVISGDTARVYDTKTGKEMFPLRTPGESIDSIAFSHDGTRIATYRMSRRNSSGYDPGEVLLWDARDGRELLGIPDSPTIGIIDHNMISTAGSVFFHPDGSQIAVQSGDRVYLYWVRDPAPVK